MASNSVESLESILEFGAESGKIEASGLVGVE